MRTQRIAALLAAILLTLPLLAACGKTVGETIDDATITHVFYPVFPPDRNAGDVLAWLKDNPRR